MFKKLFIFLILSNLFVFAQIPSQLQGISPSSVSKSDLDTYGVSQSDVERILKQYGGTPSTPSAPAKNETVKEVVVDKESTKEEEVKPTDSPAPNKDNDPYVYGRDLFNNKNLKVYESATHIKAPSNYILGVADEITVNIWGYSEHSGVYRIDDDGAIQPKIVGKIYLKGNTFAQAQQIIKSRFSTSYDLANSQISIELNYSKVIRVNIVGEVKNPGTYSVPAINSVFNILSLAGGINKNGTVRNIEVKRAGKTVKVLDVYAFLKNPSFENDFFLMENDFIVVNNIGNVVELKGKVKRQELYELKPNEGIIELLEYSGGILSSAYTEYITLYRYQDNKDILIEVPYAELVKTKKNFLLKDGDRIEVKNIPSETRNRVEISGEVNLSGSFLYTKGMTVKDLIIRAEGLKTSAFLEKAIIRRIKEDFTIEKIEININNELAGITTTVLNEFDKITIASKKDFNDEFNVQIIGSVRNPNKFEYSENYTLADLLFMAGGVLPEADLTKVEITRKYDFKTKTALGKQTVETIEIDSDIISEKNKSYKLLPGDVVMVRKNPMFKENDFVTIEGEIKYPGTYIISAKDEKISDLLARAGGLTDWAFLEGAYIERTKVIDGDAFTVLDLKKLIDGGEKRFDYIIRAGDKIVIPRTQDFIKLSGAVRFPKVAQFGTINIPVHNDKNARFYVNKYGGGFDKNAKKSKIYVESPGGQAKRTINFGLFKIYPKVRVGDHIYIDYKEEKIKKEKDEKDKIDWTRVIESTSTKLTGIATFYLLLQRITAN
jgi:protein involved in polysaccharide export with SLBB domain